ncbi:MAG: hypothetical protein NTX50_18870 [Candidatus Sumerlaeota bacterium]|nr:hypothetical protein [Candidatus Sumerlaeota bacterium]
MMKDEMEKGEISRRNFFTKAVKAAGSASFASVMLKGVKAKAAEISSTIAAAAQSSDVPMVCYHAHLDNLGLDKALEIAQQKGVKLGIVEHAGTKENKYPIVLSSDEDLKRYIAMLEGKPVFKGIQAEYLDWMTCFSKDVVAQLDFVLTDAMTFQEKDGSRAHLWKKEEVKISDAQDFMERYTDYNVRVMATEPIDILASPTYLPEAIVKDFDTLWTPERMKKIIDAALKHNVALEISSGTKLPRLPFLKLAKQAGAKFSFGSNIRGANIANIDYCLEMAKELGLKKEDIFTPAPMGKKPIQIRKF